MCYFDGVKLERSVDIKPDISLDVKPDISLDVKPDISAQTLPANLAVRSFDLETSHTVKRERPLSRAAMIKRYESMSLASAPPSYLVVPSKHQAGAYDIAPLSCGPDPFTQVLEVEHEGTVVTGKLSPAQLVCPHPERRRRFATFGILGDVLYYPLGLRWSFCMSRYQCNSCWASLR